MKEENHQNFIFRKTNIQKWERNKLSQTTTEKFAASRLDLKEMLKEVIQRKEKLCRSETQIYIKTGRTLRKQQKLEEE